MRVRRAERAPRRGRLPTRVGRELRRSRSLASVRCVVALPRHSLRAVRSRGSPKSLVCMERATGIEPATFSLGSLAGERTNADIRGQMRTRFRATRVLGPSGRGAMSAFVRSCPLEAGHEKGTEGNRKQDRASKRARVRYALRRFALRRVRVGQGTLPVTDSGSSTA